jgi:hypothetical protein
LEDYLEYNELAPDSKIHPTKKIEIDFAVIEAINDYLENSNYEDMVDDLLSSEKLNRLVAIEAEVLAILKEGIHPTYESVETCRIEL